MPRNLVVLVSLTVVALVLAACGSGSTPAATTAAADTPTVEAATDTPPPPTATPLPPPDTPVPPTGTPVPPAPTPTAAEAARLAKNGKPFLDDEPAFAFEPYWQTDYSLHTVPYTEILGVIPRDNIPAIDNPKFITIEAAEEWLRDNEPVFVTTLNGQTKAYPLQIITWHEIVNDEIGGVPVVVTFCPLCNSAITFERTLNGTVYDFGVSGKLRNSDLIMWDRQTESWWQQLTGEAIVGQLAGEQLIFVPTQLTSFADLKTAFPKAEILSRETGFQRQYGRNPYAGYDSNPDPFLFAGEADSRLMAVDRVVALNLNGDPVAYPYSVLGEARVIADTAGGEPVVIFWQEGTTSALDGAVIAGSKDVGAATVYNPNLNGQQLSFTWDGSAFVDDQTGSRWNLFGEAVEGELAGQMLTPIVYANHFWFAVAAFFPDIRIYSGNSGQK